MHGGEGAVSDSRREDDGKDGRGRDVRLVDVAQKRSEAATSTVSVEAYSLASQRRAIAYGRARGRS